MDSLLDYKFLVPLALLLGLAPFFPQPHIVEKLAYRIVRDLLHRA